MTTALTLPATHKIVRFFSKYDDSKEYSSKGNLPTNGLGSPRPGKVLHNLSHSDAESWTLTELLSFADEECRSLWNNLDLAYTTMNGHRELRKEIAKYIGVKDEDKVIAVSSQEGIHIAMRCTVDYLKKKYETTTVRVVVMEPTFTSLFEHLRVAGCEIDKWRLKFGPATPGSQVSRWYFDIDELLDSLLKADTRLIVLNFPHNPTGYCPSRDDLERLVAACRQRDIILFVDEVFRDVSRVPLYLPLPCICTLYENAISLGSLSKAFGMGGLRVGWLCTGNAELRKSMEGFKDYVALCISAPSEILGLIAMRNVRRMLERNRKLVEENVELLEKFIQKYPNLFEWFGDIGHGTTTLVRLRQPLLDWGRSGEGLGKESSAGSFCDKLICEAGIALLPGEAYDFGSEYVRVGLGKQQFGVGLTELDKFLVDNFAS